MFIEPKTLIVVYKDELLLNQLKKLVETDDDDKETGKTVGTEDGSITIVAWDEEMWLSQKKAGTVEDKVLFIGNVKGIDKLKPLIDYKFDKWGIKYGWAGKQALILVDEYSIGKKEDYEAFLAEFKKQTLPEKKKEKTPVKVVKKGGMAVLFGLVGLGASFAVDFFKDKAKLRQQLYLYGVLDLYNNYLDKFMKA